MPSHPIRRLSAIPPEAVLIVVTMVWGGTFLIVREAMQSSGPMQFVALRFGIAALLLAAVTGRGMAGLTRQELRAGLAIGATIAAGYGLQSAGLTTITASASAFITALYVPLVPLLQWLTLGRPPALPAWVGIALSTVGLILLTAPGGAGLAPGTGEVLTMIGALAIAGEVILIGRYAGRVDARRVTVVQMAAASVIAALSIPVVGEAATWPDLRILAIAVALGLCSALIQLAMNWAQRSLSPTRATLIYAGEPVWAGLFGRLAGERLPGLALVGAALIVLAVLVSEWWPRRWRDGGATPR